MLLQGQQKACSVVVQILLPKIMVARLTKSLIIPILCFTLLSLEELYQINGKSWVKDAVSSLTCFENVCVTTTMTVAQYQQHQEEMLMVI